MNSLIQMLQEFEIPYVYSHWAQGEVPETPYICYLIASTGPFSADGRVYKEFADVDLELYSDKPEKDLIRKITSVLDGHGIFYGITQTWIPEEGLYQTWFTFEMEVE